ncbi:MAG: hypothetical protein K2Y32_08620 [Candidatus Obscuribacterales bacterium]|nr:hypothetical protein [Candidatus Obscuribacterales bacterium]
MSRSSVLVSHHNSVSPSETLGSSGFVSTSESGGFLGLSAFSGAAWSSPSAKPKLVRALVTKQLENTAGHFQIYLTKDAIRIDGFLSQASIIAKAPSWEVVSFNKEGFRYAMPLAAWRRTGLGANATDLRPYFADDLKVERSEQSAYGHKVVCFSRRLRFLEYSKQSKQGQAGAGEVGQIRLRLATDVDLSEGAQDVLRGFFKLPNYKGIPLSFSVESKNRKEEFHFSTESLKYEQIDPAIFVEPKGLKSAKSINRIFFGKATEDLILEFCNERK